VHFKWKPENSGYNTGDKINSTKIAQLQQRRARMRKPIFSPQLLSASIPALIHDQMRDSTLNVLNLLTDIDKIMA